MRVLLGVLCSIPFVAHSEPSVTSVSEPIADVRRPTATTPRAWFGVGAVVGVAKVDDVRNDGSHPTYGMRIDADLIGERAWFAGVTLARLYDERFWDSYPGHDGADLTDTMAIAYVGRAVRRGRFE